MFGSLQWPCNTSESILAPLSISVLQKILKSNKLKPGFAAFFPPGSAVADGVHEVRARAASASSSSCFWISFICSTCFVKYSLREESKRHKDYWLKIFRHVTSRHWIQAKEHAKRRIKGIYLTFYHTLILWSWRSQQMTLLLFGSHVQCWLNKKNHKQVL